jgi:acetyl-CoA carboxylase biotin carboxyl carrier protein
MNESSIKRLIRLVEDSEIDQLEVSSWGRKVKITRRLPENSNGNNNPSAVVQAAVPPPSPTAAPAPPAPVSAPGPSPAVESAAPSADNNYVEIKSPMVGTFYAAPAPDAPPYIKPGDKVSVGQVVCIVEAMKLMNEIESEVTGSVARIMVENTQPVEFGQVLFLIDPNG